MGEPPLASLQPGLSLQPCPDGLHLQPHHQHHRLVPLQPHVDVLVLPSCLHPRVLQHLQRHHRATGRELLLDPKALKRGVPEFFYQQLVLQVQVRPVFVVSRATRPAELVQPVLQHLGEQVVEIERKGQRDFHRLTRLDGQVDRDTAFALQ